MASTMRFAGVSRAMRGSVPDLDCAVIAPFGARPAVLALRQFLRIRRESDSPVPE